MKFLRAVHMEKCMGCHACSLACGRLVHKRLSWNTAGIRIRSSGGLTSGFEATLCLGCNPAPCAAACPTGACCMRKHGGVRIQHANCIRCGKCAAACPVEAVYMDAESGLPFVCIHCGRCVEFCPHGCIALVDTPDTAMPDTAMPDTATPGTATPNTANADTSSPGTALPAAGRAASAMPAAAGHKREHGAC